MKQKEWGLIAVIVFVSAIISLFVSKAIFVTPADRQQEVESVQPISAEFKPPKPNFLEGNYDPTQLVQIGPSNNSNPFNSSSGQ